MEAKMTNHHYEIQGVTENINNIPMVNTTQGDVAMKQEQNDVENNEQEVDENVDAGRPVQRSTRQRKPNNQYAKYICTGIDDMDN